MPLCDLKKERQEMNVSLKAKALGVAIATTAAAPLLLLAGASTASAGSCDFGGGAGGSCTSRFVPSQSNCDGIFSYLRAGHNLRDQSNEFQNEWRQCAAGPLAGSFGKG